MRFVYQICLVAAAMVASGASSGLLAQETQDKGPETVTLSGPKGDVTFKHAEHAAKMECTSCHHASKEQKPLEKPNQPCRSCHTKPPTEPMTVGLREAFHNPTAKTGTCPDCHIKEAAAGKTVPLKCSECHKKEGE